MTEYCCPKGEDEVSHFLDSASTGFLQSLSSTISPTMQPWSALGISVPSSAVAWGVPGSAPFLGALSSTFDCQPISSTVASQLHLGSSSLWLHWAPLSHWQALPCPGQSSPHVDFHGLPSRQLHSVPSSLLLHRSPPSLRLHQGPPWHRHHLSPSAPWLHLGYSSPGFCLGLPVLQYH